MFKSINANKTGLHKENIGASVKILFHFCVFYICNHQLCNNRFLKKGSSDKSADTYLAWLATSMVPQFPCTLLVSSGLSCENCSSPIWRAHCPLPQQPQSKGWEWRDHQPERGRETQSIVCLPDCIHFNWTIPFAVKTVFLDNIFSWRRPEITHVLYLIKGTPNQ